MQKFIPNYCRYTVQFAIPTVMSTQTQLQHHDHEHSSVTHSLTAIGIDVYIG